MRKFRRATNESLLYGICAGLSYHWEIPVLPLRVAVLISSILTFPVIFLVYVGLFYTVPAWEVEPEDLPDVINHGWGK